MIKTANLKQTWEILLGLFLAGFFGIAVLVSMAVWNHSQWLKNNWGNMAWMLGIYTFLIAIATGVSFVAWLDREDADQKNKRHDEQEALDLEKSKVALEERKNASEKERLNLEERKTAVMEKQVETASRLKAIGMSPADAIVNASVEVRTATRERYSRALADWQKQKEAHDKRYAGYGYAPFYLPKPVPSDYGLSD